MFKTILLTILLSLVLHPAFARGQVPYHKDRYEGGKICRYFYSGVQNGQEQLVNVQCFDE